MLAKLTTKIALRKAGIPSSGLAMPDVSALTGSGGRDGTGGALSTFANPFANLQVPVALKSWQNPMPPPVEVAPPPLIDTRAPTCPKLALPVANGTRRPCIVVFLRHCGCPFAEETFLNMRGLANKYPKVIFYAISHCTKEATDKWIYALGGAWTVQVIIDEEREVYAQWGLGVSTTYHLLNPWTQMAARKLGTEKGIWGREVDPSGNRWVVGGAWSTNELGTIKWGQPSSTADDIPKLEEAVKSLGL
ncbi:Bgt-2681 [Blumeria graminis f. sp. tritici]|uniref:Bgt-2681 n=2 Tax=Blumeria graminis f. sp. tritici TaxID=62690 RepID=A0A061HKW8_BLUGR|nr:hypothetical protein BGT96224_2681 [Blumeria graminis f. sp. tritici 96224]VDB86016.1 Bgt-2681 [Blumeria graminis f. sp. tritici]